MLQTSEGLAGFQKEDVIVIDSPGGLETCTKTKLPFQNQQGTWAPLNASVVPGLCFVWHREWKKDRFSLARFPQTSATEAVSWVLLGRAIPISEIEGDTQLDLTLDDLAATTPACEPLAAQVADLSEERLTELTSSDALVGSRET